MTGGAILFIVETPFAIMIALAVAGLRDEIARNRARRSAEPPTYLAAQQRFDEAVRAADERKQQAQPPVSIDVEIVKAGELL